MHLFECFVKQVVRQDVVTVVVVSKRGLTVLFLVLDDPGKGDKGLLLLDVFDFAAQTRGRFCLSPNVTLRSRSVSVVFPSLVVVHLLSLLRRSWILPIYL